VFHRTGALEGDAPIRAKAALGHIAEQHVLGLFLGLRQVARNDEFGLAFDEGVVANDALNVKVRLAVYFGEGTWVGDRADQDGLRRTRALPDGEAWPLVQPGTGLAMLDREQRQHQPEQQRSSAHGFSPFAGFSASRSNSRASSAAFTASASFLR